MTLRSSPSFAIGGVEPRFACLICGLEVCSMPPLEVRSLCCKHRDDHDFEDGEGYCVDCGEPRDYGDFDDDVFVVGGYHEDPRGIPASAMNGNAMARHADPAGWANWVAFCDANGHP